MKILILGHRGMLGHMVYNYLSTKDDCELTTTDLRWPDNDFKKKMLDFDGDYVVNCIGAIHQRKNQFDVIIDLQIWLDKNIGDLEPMEVAHTSRLVDYLDIVLKLHF